MKRRQIHKCIQGQQRITDSFQQCKNGSNLGELAAKQLQQQKDPNEKRLLNYDNFNGAKDNHTPYRSVTRVNKLLQSTNKSVGYSSGKLIETASGTQSIFNQKNSKETDLSTCSPMSSFTATTRATSVYGDPFTPRDSSPKKRDKKITNKQDSGSKGLIGKKRLAQQNLDQMEYFTRFNDQKLTRKYLKLTEKKTGAIYEYPIFEESQLKNFGNHPIITKYDMTKLEVEYDYETDMEQYSHSKKMLVHELCQAIDFFVKDDPVKLVENVLI